MVRARLFFTFLPTYLLNKAPPSSLELDEVLSHRQVVVPVDAAVGKGRVRARAVGDVEPAHVAILVDRVEEAGRAVVVRACPQLQA